MKYALVDNIRTEATKGAKGICPNCGSELVAKCGDVRVHHWAHKGKRHCDIWWERETEWHRSWKNNFPEDWQEISLPDEQTGERHIADVRTSHGLVIEFQHSHIKPEERTARETFYQNMVWVVDGTRLKRDYPRFYKATKYKTTKSHIFGIRVVDECFPSAWLGRDVPVIFDFLGTNLLGNNDDERNYLYCLFPNQLGYHRIFAEISRKAFIQSAKKGEWTARVRKYMDELNQGDQKLKNQEPQIKEQLQRIYSEMATKRVRRSRSAKPRIWRL